MGFIWNGICNCQKLYMYIDDNILVNDCICLEMFNDSGKEGLLSDTIIAQWFPKLPNDVED